MIDIHIVVRDQINNEPPSWKFSCPLCDTTIPKGEIRILDTLELEIHARMHMMNSHAVSYGRIKTIIGGKEKKPVAGVGTITWNVNALVEKWKAMPDHMYSELEKGRVEQRHMMIAELLEVLHTVSED